jgi:hypothetical protein
MPFWAAQEAFKKFAHVRSPDRGNPRIFSAVCVLIARSPPAIAATIAGVADRLCAVPAQSVPRRSATRQVAFVFSSLLPLPGPSRSVPPPLRQRWNQMLVARQFRRFDAISAGAFPALFALRKVNRHESCRLDRHVRGIQTGVGQYRGIDQSASPRG